ncbi:FAD-binding oxidoreductase [Cellulomonas alba]|uniref:FAD-binding oxidoreductase n=1 Tax=Cellulomonas alba TaxID=3053467 RepID=A0ABT7SFA6_9CELL|nr:FAD-binding oxidoreductase [Cellulomonas alba]MDM7854874.1 FAD-binding oxidoreductase [Cellulomonas alba]
MQARPTDTLPAILPGTLAEVAVRPGDADYDAARTTFAGTGSPGVVLRPRTAAEVADALRFATDHGLPVAVRGGGHHALNFANVDDGAVLDLVHLDAVEHLGDGRVRVGAGATWGHAADALAVHGLAVTSGDTRSVGVGGLTQAGGIGWMLRRFGLTIDSVLAAEVVTAAGDVVQASATEHPDLFWGLRGGAGNFGVVTAFELQAQPVTTIRFGTIRFPADDVPRLVHAWAAAMRSAPDALTTVLTLMPAFGPGPAVAMLTVADCGDDPTALDELRALGTPLADDVTERPYASVLEEPRVPQGIVPVGSGTFVRQVDDGLVSAIADAYARGGRVVGLRSLGGAFGRVPADATAFAHRDAEALVVSAAFLPVGATADQVAGAQAVWRTIADQGSGAYAGFLGTASETDLAALWPEPTRRRLAEVKRAWDPENVFRRNFNVAP